MAHYGTTTTDNDALAELRATLTSISPDLAPLAEYAYDLHLDGFTDPDQIVMELEFHPVFQQFYAGIRDESGRLRMKPSEYTQFDRNVKQSLAAFGLDSLYSREFVAGLVASERSVNEVTQDLQTYHRLKRNPTLRRDFFAYTGIDPGDEGVFALALGLAPDLEKAYAQAVQGGVSAEQFVQRRLAFETQIVTQEGTITGIETELDRLDARIGNVNSRIKPLNEQIAALRTELQQRDPTTGERVVTGNKRKTKIAQIAKLRERITSLRADRNKLTADRLVQSTLLTSEQGAKLGTEAELQAHLAGAVPDLTPDFTTDDPILDRIEAQDAFQRALAHEKGRFTTGGATQVETGPRRRTF